MSSFISFLSSSYFNGADFIMMLYFLFAHSYFLKKFPNLYLQLHFLYRLHFILLIETSVHISSILGVGLALGGWKLQKGSMPFSLDLSGALSVSLSFYQSFSLFPYVYSILVLMRKGATTELKSNVKSSLDSILV